MRKPVIGVMGGAVVGEDVEALAELLGKSIAKRGWILLTGGRNQGVMAASARGAKEAGGWVIGILPDATAERASPHLDVAVVTSMGQARNLVNVLTSDVVIACPGKLGTMSEIVLALDNDKPVILLGWQPWPGLEDYVSSGRLLVVDDPAEAIERAAALLKAARPG